MKTTNREKFNALPQRQKKFARTKIALLNALLDALDTREFSSITIKELTQQAEVSEPTFFNYFDSKQDMLVYIIQMWTIQMQDLARKCQAESHSFLETIKAIFVESGKEISEHPQILLEVIAFQASRTTAKAYEISAAEKWLFFEEIEGVEALEGIGLESIFPVLIAQAKAAGELDASVDEGLLFLTLSSLFFGTSLLVLKQDAKRLPALFEAELDLIFNRLNDEHKTKNKSP